MLGPLAWCAWYLPAKSLLLSAVGVMVLVEDGGSQQNDLKSSFLICSYFRDFTFVLKTDCFQMTEGVYLSGIMTWCVRVCISVSKCLPGMHEALDLKLTCPEKQVK